MRVAWIYWSGAAFTVALALQAAAPLNAAEQGFLMADSSKFGLVLPSRIAGEEACAGLLVDRLPPDSIAAKLAENGVRVLAG